MRKIEKHSFEAVSLLTVDNGLLDVTIVPAENQPDWIIPSNLILSVDDYNEFIWTYLWNKQEVVVYHLLSRDDTPTNIMVLEGNSDVHRIALLYKGNTRTQQVNISDVKDAPMPEGYLSIKSKRQPPSDSQPTSSDTPKNHSDETPSTQFSADKVDNNDRISTYAYQSVTIDGTLYFVPDIDTLAHHLVDLDSY